eukprot:gene11265-12445_t
MRWIIITTLAVLQIFSATANKNIVLHGTLKLNRKLSSLPKDSCLVVKVEDTSIADAPSTTIASKVFKGQALQLTKQGIPYKMIFEKPEERGLSYTISATLNVDWCTDGGSKWIQNGDYLTATSYPLEITKDKDTYQEDVEMEYYGTQKSPSNVHHNKREHVLQNPCIDAPCMNSICIGFKNGSYTCIKVAMMPCALPSCSAVFDPVCASNGKSYDNECLMIADSCPDGVKISLTKIHDGECYSKHTMLGGILFSTCIVMLSIIGLISIFWIWRRNRQLKVEQQLGNGSMKKVAPMGI